MLSPALPDSLIRAFFRKAKDGEERYAVETVEEIKRCLGVTPERNLHTTHSIADGALLRLVSTVTSNYAMSQYVATEPGCCVYRLTSLRLPLKLQQSLRDLYEEMKATYSTQWTRTFPGDETQGCSSRDSSGTILRMWSHTLWLGRWMGIDSTCGNVSYSFIFADISLDTSDCSASIRHSPPRTAIS